MKRILRRFHTPVVMLLSVEIALPAGLWAAGSTDPAQMIIDGTASTFFVVAMLTAVCCSLAFGELLRRIGC